MIYPKELIMEKIAAIYINGALDVISNNITISSLSTLSDILEKDY